MTRRDSFQEYKVVVFDNKLIIHHVNGLKKKNMGLS
jgi:hypothetical protein